jgi:hypothetical protein
MPTQSPPEGIWQSQKVRCKTSSTVAFEAGIATDRSVSYQKTTCVNREQEDDEFLLRKPFNMSLPSPASTSTYVLMWALVCVFETVVTVKPNLDSA